MKKAVIEMDSGKIVIELFEKDAPITVGNFEKLIKEGFYDGLTFHRVIKGFVAQGGCPSGTGTGGIDVSSQAAADQAVTIIDNAIGLVSAERSKLGALQNRLEHTIANLGTSAENLQAAESRIRDVDMAAEMMVFTKYQILQQASTAMLAQANMAPQSVLQLLG
mgnify:CR=1 FL=1